MSICRLNAKQTTAAGSAATAAALVLYQVDGLKLVDHLHAAIPLHFVQGLLLGVGLALMVGGLIRRRNGG